MTDSQKPENIAIYNDLSLKKLAWAIQASQGQFKLILSRCNYTRLRSNLVEQLLQELHPADVRLLELEESEKMLFARIRAFLGEDVPAAVMVFGLELVGGLEQLLTASNQVREEFRKSFSFPLVLWVNDAVLQKLLRLAPDFESWATTVSFQIAHEDLANLLGQITEQWFTNNLSLTLDECIELEAELEAAHRDLLSDERNLNAELAADCVSLLGFTKRVDRQIDIALEHYHKGLEFWRQTNHLERQAKLLDEIALCYYLKAPPYRYKNHPICQEAQQSVRDYLNAIEQIERPELLANSVLRFGEVVGYVEDWEQLKYLAHKALSRHEAEHKPVELARDYGFLAEVALAQERWNAANQLARKALEVLSVTLSMRSPEHPGIVYELSERSVLQHDPSLYLFILAKSQQALGQIPAAIQNLEIAREAGSPEDDPQLYLDILCQLQRLYFQQKDYLKAFETKQKRQSIEQQYRLRAFIGAGRIQSQRQARLALKQVVQKRQNASVQETVAPEIAASGRLLDVERLIERIGRNDCKLIVIHGYSGVGKSSLVTGGLVPALKQRAIGTSDVLPVLMRVYTNWVGELGRLLAEEMGTWGGRDAQTRRGEVAPLDSEAAILEELRRSESRHLRTVLIFDQFEEFFFVYPDAAERRRFFEFVGECLKILPVKVILSLREDYLHYLLECDRLSNMTIIGNDILTKNIRYPLGNFSPDDAKAIVERLTEYSYFHLESDLIEALVQDLASELGEVRPIELQIVGAQLQAETITTLAEYRERGKKEELVERYLAEVVGDCGAENEQIANLVLYLLTDEKGTRPLKTRAEVERDLQAFASANVTAEASRLDLVFKIFVDSGLVVLLPELPADRYQLVHDYLAAFIHQQQEPKLQELMAELERERTQRKRSEEKLNRFLRRVLIGSIAAGCGLALLAVVAGGLAWRAEDQRKRAELREIEVLTNSSEALLVSEQTFDALIEALKARGKLIKADWAKGEVDTQIRVKATLLQAVYDLREPNRSEVYTRMREHNRLEAHSSAVWSVSFSPDGKTIASASWDNTVKLWNLEGKVLKTLKGHSRRVSSVSFSPDGKTIASASWDNTVKLWNLQGKELKTLKGHSRRVSSVSFSPDGKTIASASEDKTIKLWNLEGKVLKTLKGHSSSVLSVSFSPDGKTIASASEDETIKLWNLEGKVLKTLKGHSSPVYSVSFSPDGKTIASASEDNTVKLWNLQGKELETLKGHSRRVWSASFSPDGKTIASASVDNTVKLWNLQGKELKTLKGHSSPVYSVSFSPDGKMIASASADNSVKLWNLQSKELKTLKGHGKLVWSVSFSPDGKTIASASEDKTIKLWNLQGKELKTLEGHSRGVWSVSFSPDGKAIASASEDNTVKLWNLEGKVLKTLEGHRGPVLSVSFSPDGKTIASASVDNTVKLWNLQGKELKTLEGHSRRVWRVSFSLDSKTIASASEDKTIKLWNLEGKVLETLKGHSSSVFSVSFSPDGNTIASASEDNTVKLWNLQGKELKTLKGHSSPVWSVSFSPDGNTIASASWDNTVKLWNLQGKELKTLKGHNSFVSSVSFSPDGNTIASASHDKTVTLWNLNFEGLEGLETEGCQWLHDYLVTHPRDLQTLEVCHSSSILMAAAPYLVKDGEEQARQDNIKASVDDFHQALKWNPNLTLNPQAKAQQLAKASDLVKQGEDALDNGNIESAIATFQAALQLDPNLDFSPKTKAASMLVMNGEKLVWSKKFKEAISTYTKAQSLDPNVEIATSSWNDLCRQGSLSGFTTDVMLACKKGVAIAPNDGDVRDSRGIARALIGNKKGAIEDFQAFINWTDNKDKKSQRQRWINELRASKYPFTPEEIKNLLIE